jgi:transposase-like protein
MARFREKLGAKQEAAILALLTARSIEEAARTANVPPRTLYRWLNEPEFSAAYLKAKRAVSAQSNARLQQASGAAVTTLLKLIVDNGVPAAVRARAAYYILTLSAKAMETEDIEARLTELERAAELSKESR